MTRPGTGTVEHVTGSQQADRPSGYASLADRDAVLAALTRLIAEAWESFERPRPEEPAIDDEVRERLALPLPELPADPSQVLGDAARILDESVSPSRPLYLAYVGSTGLEVGVLADALTATYDVNLAVTARAADLVERQAVEWVAQFVGFPCAEGAFTSGGMTSNLTGLLAARERALPGCRVDGFAGRQGTVYCSAESHHSVVRGAEAAGIGSSFVRSLAFDERRRMRVPELDRALGDDRATGLIPVAVVANGGTTLTGAVDPLAAIADVCERHGVWLHVDGAYGLPAAATEVAGPLFAGLERADSVTLDAHKWLGLQKACSLVLVREPGALEATFGHEEAYMRRDEVRNAVERTLEYSRPLRSLKLWLAFRTHGAAAFRGWIENTVELARELAAEIRADPEFELLCEPTLSTVCFRHLPADRADLDDHNTELAAAAQRDGRIYLASAVLDDRVCLRACFVNFRTRREDLGLVLATLRELALRPASGGPASA
ncbi:MAG: aminotransferase class V-fold PLP-dependent enzyme [Solirubrobacterales bacterium]|nr:aminotransferase class V-fold PLP-dependent enzyme [Solirubrobacterales bacterium]